nr:MAG TPA: hypothetical protein [Caudoviricetes sp.]
MRNRAFGSGTKSQLPRISWQLALFLVQSIF